MEKLIEGLKEVINSEEIKNLPEEMQYTIYKLINCLPIYKIIQIIDKK